MKSIKFATLIDASVFKDMKAHAKAAGVSISKIVTEAIREYLNKSKVRPAFGNAMNEVLAENEELLKRLAK